MTHKFKIKLTPNARGSTVEMDGATVGVRSISIRAGLNEVTTVILEIPAAHVEIEAEGEVEKLWDVTRLGHSSTADPR